ncbi:MAG: hypothetical protein ACHP6H_02020 [Legionellales bacterium]
MSANIPTAKGIVDASAIAQATPEAANYNYVRIAKIFAENKLTETCKETLESLRNIAELARLRFKPQEGIQKGEPPLNDFQNLQANIGKEAAEAMVINGAVRIDYAVSSEGQYLRGISGDALIEYPALVEPMDKAFNSWLALDKNNPVVSVNGFLFKANADGTPLESNGTKVPIKPEELAARINDPETGFMQYLNRLNIKNSEGENVDVNNDIEVVEQRFPEGAVEAAARAAEEARVAAAEAEAKAAAVKVQEPAPKTTEEAPPEPSAPSTGGH